jgi:hypothetical protein
VKRGRKKDKKRENNVTTAEKEEEDRIVAYEYLMKTSLLEVIDFVKDDLSIQLTDEEIEKNIDCALKEYIKLYKDVFKV